ncbi:hypothetical protein CCHOA_02325 [Corynebacterium choanae]|uniref:Uncharacterized protein n=1 Tax=Corynebacterium choanae TaxID=1862358 RepID=A0A3G6J4R8_9CORY|nr:hypothetical protein CCHOA_02325 [Corynebacterium choanae]
MGGTGNTVGAHGKPHKPREYCLSLLLAANTKQYFQLPGVAQLCGWQMGMCTVAVCGY